MMIEQESNFECGFPVESCEGCPVMSIVHEDWHDASEAHGFFNEMGELLVGDHGRLFDETIAEIFEVDPDEAGAITTSTRQQVAEVLDVGDEKLASIAQNAKELSDSCNGPLAMKAKKHGTTFVVRICTSPLPYGPDKTAVMPAEITRKDPRH